MTTTPVKERAEKAADDFCNAVNEMGFDAEAFAQQIRRNHRTIQQNVGGAFLELLTQWEQDHATENYDARNQAVCEFAYDVATINPRRFPFI